MVLKLPRRGECNASIRSRDDDACPYCGTVYPWELWDEISSLRVELVEADAATFEAATFRVERSNELAGKVLRESSKRRRRRPRRPDASREGPPVTLPSVLFAFGGFFVAVLGGGAVDGMRGMMLGLVAFVTVSAVVEGRRQARRMAEYHDKRRTFRAEEKVVHVAAGALEVTAPATHGQGAQRRRARTVLLHTSTGDQHVCLATPDASVTPGDIGIATLRGMDLVDFDAKSRVDA
ncbi:MAG: hypothetical protein AAGB93_07850 [Planctomycetota bacterium]